MRKLNTSTYYDPQKGIFVVKSVTEEPVADPEIIVFKSDRTLLKDDLPAVITWKVRNASAVFINKTPVALEGNMPFHSMKPQVICIVAKNRKKKIVEKKINIDIDKTSPVIHYFKSDRSFVVKNYPMTLSWNITGAKKIKITNIGDVSGRVNAIATSTESGVYTLVAESFFGIKSERILSLPVLPIPRIEGLAIPLPQFKSESITSDVPTFNLQINLKNDINVYQPSFTNLIPLARLSTLSTKILLKEKTITSILFSNDIFNLLIKMQKKIVHIIKMSWKNTIKEKLKRSL